MRSSAGENTTYVVIMNHEEMYSVWPEGRAVPLGWTTVGVSGTREECLAYIEEVWIDMRPLSLR
ncbi:antibiotic synthesis protein MbtH [Cryobacterium sp. MLB-32]|nr:antibiotic synthesis protein MbtH [Cryobacterium sp. MLB-32]